MLPFHRQQLTHSKARQDRGFEEQATVWRGATQERADFIWVQVVHRSLGHPRTLHDGDRVLGEIPPPPGLLQDRVQLPHEPVEGGRIHPRTDTLVDESLQGLGRDTIKPVFAERGKKMGV